MGKHDYSKWNKYKIGSVPFINSRINHPHRQIFVDFVVNNNISSVIEIGPGELIEYKLISKKKKVSYAIVDVSDLFLDNCTKMHPEIVTYKSAIEDINPTNLPVFDVVYAASVLEHARDVKLMITKMLSISKQFHFVLFKWKYSGGKSLRSEYHKKKGYWSTSFNIYSLIDFISKSATIEYTDVVRENGDRICHENYKSNITGEHRNGNYLIIHGSGNRLFDSKG